MRNGMDWFLEKMKLSEMDDIEEEPQEEENSLIWYERYMSGKSAEVLSNPRIFCKKIESYEDAKEVICEYKAGTKCVIVFNQIENPDAQGMMNYICGGIYALGGVVSKVNGDVYVVNSAG